MTYDEIIHMIDRLAPQHQAYDEDDLALAESLERDITFAIFEYIESQGIELEGIALPSLLDAIRKVRNNDDSADAESRSDDAWNTLLTLESRIVDAYPTALAVPPQIKALFDHYQNTFWPSQL